MNTDLLVIGSVYLTETGYPAIISEKSPSKTFGLVLSPEGPKLLSWDKKGKNEEKLPSFYDLKLPPALTPNRCAIIKNNRLIGMAPDIETAKEIGDLNDADLVIRCSELLFTMFPPSTYV